MSADEIIHIATQKLLGAKSFLPSNPNHALAVLGQRFGLDVAFGHPDSVAHLESAVASHLRVCIATTADRVWRFTSYPSEPLLSCVAAEILHQAPDHLTSSLSTLQERANKGMIDIGQRGELASRLLWLLGKDLYVRTKVHPGPGVSNTTKKGERVGKLDMNLIDCQMIKVIDFFTFLFGVRFWSFPGAEKARTAFEHAYVNFSHWVPMEQDIAGKSSEKFKWVA